MRASILALVGLLSFSAVGTAIWFGPKLRDLALAGSAHAQVPVTLGPLRTRLATFQTLFAHVEYERRPSCSGRHGTACQAVLRFERSSGHATWDQSSFRLTWDGEHLWRDGGRPSATQLGPEADEIASVIVSEVFSGFANSTITPQGREAWPPRSRWDPLFLLDLPGTWDDPFAILLLARQDSDRFGALTVLDRQTGEVVQLPSLGFRFDRMRIPVEWNVRLEPDLDQVEDINSRTVVLEEDSFEGVIASAGPSFLPPYHELSTRMPLVFDSATSQGTVVEGVEQPFAQLGPFTCSVTGSTQTVPIDLDFRIDPTHEYYAFLEEAVAGDCPLRAGLGMVLALDVAGQANASIQANLTLRSGSTPLANASIQKNLQGPGQHKSEVEKVLNLQPDLVAEDLWLSLEGNVQVGCSGSSSGTTLVRVGVSEEKAPTTAWDGCYPEYGTYPDPEAEPRPVFPEPERSPL